MITPREAAEASAQYFKDLSNVSGTLLVEEIEKSTDKKHWLVTISHPNQLQGPQSAIGILYGNQPESRSYKLFTVDGNSGEVLSMKIKKIT